MPNWSAGDEDSLPPDLRGTVQPAVEVPVPDEVADAVLRAALGTTSSLQDRIQSLAGSNLVGQALRAAAAVLVDLTGETSRLGVEIMLNRIMVARGRLQDANVTSMAVERERVILEAVEQVGRGPIESIARLAVDRLRIPNQVREFAVGATLVAMERMVALGQLRLTMSEHAIWMIELSGSIERSGSSSDLPRWVLGTVRSMMGRRPTLEAIQGLRPPHFTEESIRQCVTGLLENELLVKDGEGGLIAWDDVGEDNDTEPARSALDQLLEDET